MKKICIIAMMALATINSKAQVQVGQMAPEITLPGVNDSLISLSSLKGKVVLIDFWASWCDPCRRANPSMVQLYNKYKDKGLEVLAVSIDLRKSDWLRAIKHDKLVYMHVNANKGWKSPITYTYHIDGVPANFLVDRMGVLVGANIKKEELEKKVEALLQ